MIVQIQENNLPFILITNLPAVLLLALILSSGFGYFLAKVFLTKKLLTIYEWELNKRTEWKIWLIGYAIFFLPLGLSAIMMSFVPNNNYKGIVFPACLTATLVWWLSWVGWSFIGTKPKRD